MAFDKVILLLLTATATATATTTATATATAQAQAQAQLIGVWDRHELWPFLLRVVDQAGPLLV